MPMTYWHGTISSALPSIRREGLIPAKGKGGDTWARSMAGRLYDDESQLKRMFSRPPMVYVANDPYEAKWMADRVASLHPHAKPVVLELAIPKSVHLIPDEQYKGIGFAVARPVPPSWLKAYYEPDISGVWQAHILRIRK